MKSSSSRARLGIGAAVVLALSFGAVGVPAQAESVEAQAGDVLEVEVRPAIATPSGVVTVAAEYELEEAEEEGTEEEGTEEEGAEESGEDTGSVSLLRAATAAVEMVVDFGDGSAPQAMRIAGDSDEVKGFGKHAYAAEGTYTVTVTATPSAGTPVSVPVQVHVGGGSARLGGKDRFETANRLAREDFPTDGEAGAVLLARSDAFADALAAAPVAVLQDAPVLLTATAQLPASVHAEIARALGGTGRVYILGGEGAIAPSVADELTAAGYDVVRIAGDDRVETALQLARFLVDAGVAVDEVLLTGSTNFPDALSGAAFAASADAPVLLTAPGALDPRVLAFLQQLGDVEVHVAGGAAAVGDQVVADLRALGFEVERLSGRNRYETSAEIASTLFPTATTVVLATGSTFPDALAGAAAAGRRDAAVLLVGAELPEAVREYLQAGAGRIEAVYVLGGEGAVAPGVLAEVNAILGL